MTSRVYPYQLVKVVGTFSFAAFALMGLVGGLPVEVILVRTGFATTSIVLFTLIVIRVLKEFARD